MARPTWRVRFDDIVLPVWVTRPNQTEPTPTLVLAPGAGTAATHPWLRAQARALAARGVTAVRFDFPYRVRDHRAPDRLPVLVRAYGAIADRVRAAGVSDRRLYLGGKSMGGRVASHLAAEGDACAGLVFYGYPLAPRGRVDPQRTAHWPAVTVPALFCTGTRDRLCPLPALEAALGEWGGATAEFHVPDGDHSFKVPKRTGRSDADVHTALADAVARWLRRRGR